VSSGAAFDIPEMKCRLVDISRAPTEDRRLAIFRMQEFLLKEIADKRPGVTMCHRSSGSDVITYVVYHEGRVQGIFSIYELQKVKDRFIAMPMPGFAPWGETRKQRLWGRMMNHFIENEIVLLNGDKIELAQWNFPDTEEHRWKANDREHLEDLFEEMSSHKIEKNKHGVPVKVSRVVDIHT